MPKLHEEASETPQKIRAFTHHGVELHEHNNQHDGQCPFCTADKFTVQTDTGVWRCWVCGRAGNPLEFLRQLYEASIATTDEGWLRKLADDRKLMNTTTLRSWGACKSAVDGAWMLAGYDIYGKLAQLYRRVQTQNSSGAWSWKLLPTPGVWPEGRAHALHVASINPEASIVYFFEGPWDAMAFWEVATRAKRVDDALEQTGSLESSLLSDANVFGVPGCTVWQEFWTELCRGKDVVFFYDNDHPRENNGVITMAGWDGMKRAAGKVIKAANSISVLQWGEGGFDSQLANGFDVRDALTKGM